MIDLDLFICFSAVAEDMSFRKAAERLAKDQSWLSRRVRKLEDYVGARLFARNTRSVELTADGQALLPYARELAKQANAAQGFAQQMRHSRVKRLRIGAAAYSAYQPRRVALVNDFIVRHPKVDVEVLYGVTPRLIEWLRQRRIDVAFVSMPFDDEGLEKLPFLRSSGGVWLPAEDPLAQQDIIRLPDLRGRRIAALTPKIKSPLRKMVYDRMEAEGATIVRMPESERSAIRLYSSAQRLVVFSFDGPDDPELKGDDVVFRPLDCAEIYRDMYLVRLPDSYSAPAQWFWDSVAAT